MKKTTLLNRILAVALTLAFMLSMPGMSAIAEAADNSKSESKDLKDFLSAVTITDADGNSIGKTLADGENYKIHLEFSEKGAQSIQLSTEGTLTYQIPTQLKIKDHSDKPLNIKIKGSDGGEEEVTIGKYSVDENGLLTVELNDEGRSKLAEMNNAVLSFDMEATADVTHGSSSGSVDFGDVGEGFTFEITDQPRVRIEKDGVYTENADKKTGGTLSYTVKVTVEHGELNDATLNDVLTPPQNSAFSLSDPKDFEVTLKRSGDPDEHTLTVDDYELTGTVDDPNHPGDKAFRIKIKEESAYAPLKEGDELCFTYTYDVNVSNPNLHLWANMENVATFTGTMPVKDPGDPNKVENISVEEEANDSCEVRMSPDGHGVICKDQSYSEATKTLHYTCYTVVPAGEWSPLQIYDDMYVQYNGEKWYLKEFKPNGKVKNLTVKAVDVEEWFGGDDWADNTPAPDKIKSFSELAEKAKVLTGYSYDGWNVPDEYNSASRDNYLYYFADKSLYIIFGDAQKEWGEWGSWDYNKDRLIITEYDLDMSSTEPMTLYDIDDEGNYGKTLELTPEEVLKAGITNNVSLRYGGYFPGYSVFFNNADDMIKTGELNKADGTIDYTVTINTTDSTVLNYFVDVAADHETKGWNYNDGLQAIFYDELPDGWEYVENSLYATTKDMYGTVSEFHYNVLGISVDAGVIKAPLVGFKQQPEGASFSLWDVCRTGGMIELSFHYQLKATPDWLKAHATANEPVPVNNHAEIKDNKSSHWSADKTIEYYPAKLTKKAEVVDDNGDLLKFTLTINPEGADLDPNSETLKVVDKSENLEIVKSSIEVKNTNTNKKVDVTVETETVKAEDGSGEKLQLTIVVPDGVPLNITYEARIPKKGVGIQVSNSAGIEGVAQSDDGYSSLLNVDHIAQSGSGSAFDMTVKKVDADTKAPLAGATFKLYIELKEGSVLPEDTSNPIQGYRVSYIDDYTTGEDGTAHINSDKLGPDNWYFLVETNAPEGYEKSDKPIRFYYGLRDDTTSREDIAVNPYGTLEVPNTPALGSLTVEKVVKGDGGDPNKDFHFTVTLSDTSINSTYGDMVFENGVAEFTLKHSESKTATGLPVGIGYTVTEEEANKSSYSTTSENETGTITDNGVTVKFTNTRGAGDLEVKKTVVGVGADTTKGFNFTVTLDEPLNGTYGELTFANGVANFTLTNGEVKKAAGLPEGIGYSVLEKSIGSDYSAKYSGEIGKIEADNTAEVEVTNTRKSGSLSIKKVVDGEGCDKTKEFTFSITFSGKGLEFVKGKEFECGNSTKVKVNDEGKIVGIKLKDGETFTVTGLPTGLSYTVTEAEANKNNYETTYSVTTDKKDGNLAAGLVQKGVNSGTVEGDTAVTVTVTNTFMTGDLVVTKSVVGTDAETDRGFHFTVSLSDTTINGTYGAMNFTDGVAKFDLKHGESATAKDLPAGITYTVTEERDGEYATSFTGETGKIEYKETATAAFTNTRKTGGLTVTKTVSVSKNNDENASFEFTVKLGKALTGDYGQMHFENGVATFTLKDGESKTASGLPTGITYEVTEKNDDKYVTTYSMTTVTKEDSGLKTLEKEVTQNGVNSGTVDEDATVKIAFTNTFKTGGLTVTKTVTGNGADLEKLFHFTVSLSDTTINGDYGDMHFTNGVADLYLSNNDGTATATDLPVGVKYTVIEDRDGEYNSTFTDEIGEIEYDKTATAAFTNTRKTGDLTVTKVVEGKGGDLNNEFHFTVTLENKTINGTYGEMEFENGVAAFTLKSGESKTATGLPTGLGYTVKESEENQDNYVTVYTLTTVVKDDYGTGTVFEREVTLTGVSSGVIAEDDSAKVTVTNAFKTGGLEIEKVVTLNGEEDPSDETEFTFTLKLDNEKINGEYGEYADDESTEHKKIAFTNGEATFALKHGQRVIFSDLPDGTVYTLTEVNNPNYFETSAMTGTVRYYADGRTETLTVANVRKTGGLEIEKVVTLNGKKDESDKTEFGFTLTLDNSEISGEYGDVKFKNGIASFTLKQGETVKIDGIPNGTGYTLTEDPNSDYREAGKISGVINHYTDKKPDKLTVTNVKATGDLTVKKTVDGGGEEAAKKTFTFTVTADGVNVPDGKYGDIEFKNGSAAVTITGNGTATAKGLPIGTYKVTENSEERNISEWKLEVSPEGGTAEAEVVNRGETTVEIVNKYTKSARYVPGVKKTVENEPKEKKVFKFKLKDASGAVIDTVEATGSQTVSFDSISYDKEGTYVYTITEVDPHAANDQLVDYYEYDSSEWTLTVTVTRNADTGELEAAAKYTKGSTTSDAYAEFVNKYVPVGSFSVTKTVKGVETDTNFSITVTAVGNSALSGTYGGMTFVDGTATFTLENGQTVTASGVPTGTYTVEEDTSTAAVSGYRLSVESKTHETVTVGVGGDVAVEIVNSYEPNPGTLVVKKTVTGSGNPDTEFNFTVALSDASVNGDRGEMTFKDGVATFTLKSGESKAASNLPAGTTYTVVEVEANTGDYVTSYNGVAGAENAAGTIETEKVSNVEVKNHRPEGKLSIEKKVVGGGDAGAKQDYSFEITGPENYRNTVTVTGNGKQELKGLVPGTYTITEASADIENYTLKVTTGEGEAAVEGSSVTVEVSADETAKAEVIFTNTYTSALGSLTIKKTVKGGGAEAANKTFTFTVTGPSYPEGHDVTITGSGTAALENLTPGIYTVTEKGGDAKGYDLEVTGGGEAEITADKVTEIDVTNTYTQKPGSLKLTKTVVGGGEEAAAKTYTFKVTGPNGYSGEVEINGNGSETLTDLVPGVYTVTEVRDGTEVNGYDLAVTGENDVTVEAENTAEITITNTYTQKLGKLTVVKSLVGGEDEAKAKTYTFTVTGPNGYSNTVTITGSGTATLEDLVPGVYTVSEENAAIEGYSLEVSGGGNATVEAEKTATVAVVNIYKPELGSLTITKVVVGGGEEAANKAYTFAVSGPNGYSNTVTVTGNGTATLDSLVPGAYTVTEENAGITGYTWAVSGDNGVTVESNKTATVTVVNTYEPMLGSLTIRKVVNAPVTEPTPDEIAADTVIPAVPAYFNVRVAGADGNTGGYDVVHTVPANGSITIEGLVPGLYTVTEVDAGVPGLTWSATGSGDVTVVGGSGAEVTITNNYTIPSPEVGTLIISKAIFGAEEKALNKTFVFDVTGSNGYTNTVTVTGAGSAVLTDLEPAVYTVTERNADIEGYTWSVSVSGEGNVTVGGTAEVTVTNSYTELPKGSLTVNKTVIGGGEEAENKVYAFNVTGPNGYSGTVTVTGTGSVTITDLEPGTYTVTEVREGTEIEGYTLSVTDGGTAVVGYGTASDVNVTNNYTENPKGSLRITKTVTGDTEAAEGKVFIFDIAGPEGYTNTVTVAAGGSVTVSDLKPGTYTVTERSGEIEGYTLEVTGEGDYPVGTEEVEAAINNNYAEIPKGSLTVTKTVTGDTEAAEGKVFIFGIAGPDGYTDTVTVTAGESVTIADLEPGTYTVTERNGEIEGYTLEVTGEGDYTVGAEEISIEIVNNYTEILKGSLVINKEVVGGGEEAVNKTYTFDVTGPEGYSTTVTVTGNGSAVLTDLTLGEYTITEQNAEIEGCTLEVTGSGTVTVEGNENAEITVTNTYTETPKGSLVISKEVVGGGSEASEKTYTFEVTGPNGYSAEVTVIGNGSATLNSLEPGIYTVSEKDAAIEGYTLEVAGEGETEVIANENAAVTITNTYEQIVGSMTITKSVVGGGDEAANKIYTFVITGPNDYSNTVTVIGSGSVTVEGLVPGEYTVTEQNAEIEGYRLTVDGTETATVVADENVDVTITNSYDLIVGSLTITKSVVGGPEDAANREYTFLVTGPDGYAATVTVTGNGSATLEGLVPGEYTVTEQNAEIEGYSLTVDGEAAVTVIADQNIDITITNNYELLLGSLTLTKAITGGGEGAANRIYTFVVTGPEGYSNTVNIIGSGSVTLTDLIPGEYIVTEQNAEISGYRWNVSGEGAVTAVGGEGVQLTVTNTYDELRDINVYKEWYVNGSRTSAPYGAQITVVLLADGEATGDRLTLSEGSNWSGAFTGLPVNAEDGHEIVYTVAEVYYAGWTSSVSGSADAGFVITNYTTTPEIPNIPNVPDNPYTPPTTPENPDVPYFPNNTFDIPDFGTPLSDIPDAEPPLTDIPDIDVPLDAFPATGDESRTYLWAAVMLFSGLGIIVLIAMLIADGRKSRENSESAE